MSFTTSHRNRKRRNEDSSIYKHSIIQWKKWLFIYTEKYNRFPHHSFAHVVLLLSRKAEMAGHSFPVSLGLPRWRPCQIPDPGEGTLSNFSVGSPPPPPTLGLNIDRCIIIPLDIGPPFNLYALLKPRTKTYEPRTYKRRFTSLFRRITVIFCIAWVDLRGT